MAKMVNDSVSAYVDRDLELARKVMDADDRIDALFDEIRTKVINLIAEGNRGEQGVDLIMIANIWSVSVIMRPTLQSGLNFPLPVFTKECRLLSHK